MKKLKNYYIILKNNLILSLILLFFSNPSFSNQVLFDIQGNNFTDTDVILSILKEVPDTSNTRVY